MDKFHTLMGPSKPTARSTRRYRSSVLFDADEPGSRPFRACTYGQFMGAMRSGEPFVSGNERRSARPISLLARRGAAVFASSTPQAFGRSAFASAERFEQEGAEAPSEAALAVRRRVSTVVETQRDVEGLELPSRITSSARRAEIHTEMSADEIGASGHCRGKIQSPHRRNYRRGEIGRSDPDRALSAVRQLDHHVGGATSRSFPNYREPFRRNKQCCGS